MNIVKANATYTGGGFYAYIAELENGNYFVGADDWDGGCEVDAPIDFDDDNKWSGEWFDLHTVKEYDNGKPVIEVIDWIVANKPNGNYQASELLERKERYAR